MFRPCLAIFRSKSYSGSHKRVSTFSTIFRLSNHTHQHTHTFITFEKFSFCTPRQQQTAWSSHIATPTIHATCTNKRNNPHKDSTIQEDKGEHPHTAMQRTFQASLHTARNLHFCKAKNSTQKTVCPAHWTTQGEPIKSRTLQDQPTRKKRPQANTTTSSRTPNRPPQHPKKRVQPGTPQILSVFFLCFFSFSVTFLIQH
jgi:hypothetical protein